MYCSSCGVSVTQRLSYCNHCGAKLDSEKGDSLTKASELRAESLTISAMVGLFVLGLLAIAVLIGVMKAVLDLDRGQILGFAALSFLIMLLIEGVLVWRLSRRKRNVEEASDVALSTEQTTKELEGIRARPLPEGMSSVTDQTTRTLEPIYSEQKAK
jgi:membrane protein implicated in regulation of membrane protease activity